MGAKRIFFLAGPYSAMAASPNSFKARSLSTLIVPPGTEAGLAVGGGATWKSFYDGLTTTIKEDQRSTQRNEGGQEYGSMIFARFDALNYGVPLALEWEMNKVHAVKSHTSKPTFQEQTLNLYAYYRF